MFLRVTKIRDERVICRNKKREEGPGRRRGVPVLGLLDPSGDSEGYLVQAASGVIEL